MDVIVPITLLKTLRLLLINAGARIPKLGRSRQNHFLHITWFS